MAEPRLSRNQNAEAQPTFETTDVLLLQQLTHPRRAVPQIPPYCGRILITYARAWRTAGAGRYEIDFSVCGRPPAGFGLGGGGELNLDGGASLTHPFV